MQSINGIQLEIDEPDDMIFEWISYNQFNDIKEIGEEGFDKVYLTIWKDVPLNYNKNKNEYIRNNNNNKVVLKLYNLQNLINEFFIDEDKKYSITYISEVLKIYGISQHPNTKDYIIVFQDIFCEKCGKNENEEIDIIIQEIRSMVKSDFQTFGEVGEYNNLFIYGISQDYIMIFPNESCKRCGERYIDKNYAKNKEIVTEWIPYNQFNNIEEIVAEYKVNLKLLKSIITNESLSEVKAELNKYHFKVFGISQNLDTKDFILVLQEGYDDKCEKCGKDNYVITTWKDSPLRYYNNKKWSRESNKNCDGKYMSGYSNVWCKECEINDLKLNFKNWTSGNDEIDDLIQKIQLETDYSEDIMFEWIPFIQFIDVKTIEENDATKIYSAIWKNDILYYDFLYDCNKHEKKLYLIFF
ncbi:unnamed protein product [Rhizophagus irregularis]|nr:unnamed protein product [Rhizophagus irregularis]